MVAEEGFTLEEVNRGKETEKVRQTNFYAEIPRSRRSGMVR
jgi:hypothetical protein